MVGRISACSLSGQEGAVLRLIGRDEASDGRRAGLASAALSARINLGQACPLGTLPSAVELAHPLTLGRVLPATAVGVVGDAPLTALAVAGEPAAADIEVARRLGLATRRTALGGWAAGRDRGTVMLHHGVGSSAVRWPSARLASAPGPLSRHGEEPGRTPGAHEIVHGTGHVPLGNGGMSQHVRSANVLVKRDREALAGTTRTLLVGLWSRRSGVRVPSVTQVHLRSLGAMLWLTLVEYDNAGSQFGPS